MSTVGDRFPEFKLRPVAAREPGRQVRDLTETCSRASRRRVRLAQGLCLADEHEQCARPVRHSIDKPSDAQKPAALRMNRLAQPACKKAHIEQFSLAVNGCDVCGLPEPACSQGVIDDQAHDAAHIAAMARAAAVVLELHDVDQRA